MTTNPYIKSKTKVVHVMTDVIIALLPMIAVAILAYGKTAAALLLVSVGSAVCCDFLFSRFLLRQEKSVLDGSAVITGILLAFTLSPATPLYVVAFGGTSGILFGKLLWGGIGKNKFNPALVGREFMAAFFSSTISGSAIWATKPEVNIPSLYDFSFFASDTFNALTDGLIYKTSGALGEYSILAIFLGGLYLLWRERITWHIPFSLLLFFSAGAWLLRGDSPLNYSTAGILLAAIFMATDMPSSPVNPNGKLYYGAMMGVVSLLLIKTGVRYEYMSYSILILNGFTGVISEAFHPTAWGSASQWKRSGIESVFLLTLGILTVAFAVSALHYYHLIPYVVYLYIIYLVFKFIYSYRKQLTQTI